MSDHSFSDSGTKVPPKIKGGDINPFLNISLTSSFQIYLITRDVHFSTDKLDTADHTSPEEPWKFTSPTDQEQTLLIFITN